MSRLGELIRTLCPNGVEYKKLESLGTFYGGLTGKSKTDFDEGNAKFITYLNVYSNPSVNLNVDTFVKVAEGEKQNGIQYGDVLFTGSSETPDECGMSSVITEKVNENIYLNSFCFGFRLNETRLFEPNFLKHLFRSRELRKVITQTASGVTRFNVSKKRFGKVEIPIPPIAIQKEIAGILDKFTALEAELEAELEARKKQYEHYRDTLLDFTPPVDEKIAYKRLGDVFSTITDYTAAGSFADNAKNVKYINDYKGYAQLIRTTDLKSNFKYVDNFVYVDEHAFKYLWRVNLNREALILPNVGNCGEVYYITPEIFPNENNVLGPNAILVMSDTANLRFLFHLFGTTGFQKQLSKIVSPVGQTKFNKTNFKELVIPVPPIEEQERIVGILDKFEAICTDLCEGLPAEIEARRRQYEHYRDKLLSFKRI